MCEKKFNYSFRFKKKKKNKKLPLTMETHCPIDSKSLAMEAGDGAVSTIWP
jgi:hypothetical protein